MKSFKKIIEAVKKIEDLGIEGYNQASAIVGREIATAVLIFHLRRELGANLTYPPLPSIIEDVNKILIQNNILADVFDNDASMKNIQAMVKKIEADGVDGYHGACKVAEKDDIALALLVYLLRRDVRIKHLSLAPGEIDEKVYNILIKEKIFSDESVDTLLKQFLINNQNIQEIKRKQDQIVQNLDNAIGSIITLFNNDESSDLIITTFKIIINIENGLIDIELNNLVYRKDGSYVYEENLDEKEILPVEKKMQSLLDEHFGIKKINCFVNPFYYGK